MSLIIFSHRLNLEIPIQGEFLVVLCWSFFSFVTVSGVWPETLSPNFIFTRE